MINVCILCYNDETEVNSAEHIAEMLKGETYLRAMNIIHGPERGTERYCEMGGLIHGPSDWLKEQFGNDLEEAKA